MPETITLTNGATAAIYQPEQPENKYLLYFHGGGFVYGSKSDLPQPLAQVFLDKGYTLIATDYLLTPNNSLREVLESALNSFYELKQRLIKDAPFSFCGRSAGSYLAFQLTKELIEKEKSQPQALINFYGYYDLAFINNPRQLVQQQITPEMVTAFNQTAPVWDDPLLQRYLLYVYGVQQQKLDSYYQVTPENLNEFSIDNKILAQFPATFSTASSMDEEVPFKYSKSLKHLVSDCTFVPVYDLPHDFLKVSEDSQVQKVFQKLHQWLK